MSCMKDCHGTSVVVQVLVVEIRISFLDVGSLDAVQEVPTRSRLRLAC